MKASVVLVHGLWMNGVDMTLLRWRLHRCGFRTFQFHYSSLRRALPANASRLDQFIQTLPGERLHLVGHSLGGLVIRELFHRFPEQRPGRIVTLGTPHNASAVARHLREARFGQLLLGLSAEALCEILPAWDGRRELGVIAGTFPFGMGRFFKGLSADNDGTVAVEETRLERATDQIDMRVSHMALVISAAVAHQTCAFLKTGRFER